MTATLRTRNVRLEGLEELRKKLQADWLVQPEMESAMQTFTRRVIDRPGSGLGSRRNTLSEARSPLTMTVSSSLVFPRTTGAAWTRKNTNIIQGMSARVMAAVVRRIQERWAS